MHRFRKKSDPKRVHVPEDVVPRPLPPHHQLHQQHDPLPALPPVNDFRTSLILPDLTRRFSVLRTSSGEPIGLDDLKSKFAEQRARGSEHQVTEEEEDMILEALGRFHSKSTRGNSLRRDSIDQPSSVSGDLSSSVPTEDHEADNRASASPSFAGRQSVRSTATASSVGNTSSLSGSSFSPLKGSQASRRMSNNLFGSGKFRDASYLRTVNVARRTDSTRSSTITHSDSTTSMNTVTSSKAGHNTSTFSDSHSLRPVTPEGSTYSNSVPSSPGNDRSIDSASETSDTTTSVSTRLPRAFSGEKLRRASRALDEVIRELEEEGDDEIVMERSPITRVPSTKPLSFEPEPETTMSSLTEYEAGQAVSSDVVVDEAQRESPSSRSRQASPVPRLPGYIPGMPRPMTPHESSVDTDDHTPSATPRATSPRLPSIPSQSPMFNQSLSSTLFRSSSSASTTRPGARSHSPATPPISTSPLFFNRSPNGRYTPDRTMSTTPDPESESPLGRRRPTSPLSGQAYQSLAGTNTHSRPSTPSNITWNPSAGSTSNRAGRSGSFSGHSRNNSTTSIGVTSTEALAGHTDGLDRSKSLTRSLRSPALPDSPFVDSGYAGISSVINQGHRPPSAMSGIDLGSPAPSPQRPLRSPTPTRNGTSSPSGQMFPSFTNGANGGFTPSPRVSRQNAHNSFNMSPAHALLLQPLVNSSRSSLESAGSSYHSWDEDHKKDRLFGFFAKLDPQQPEWHDITISVHDKSSTSTSGNESSPSYGGTAESEELVRREIGLTKNDFVSIQDKLVSAALTKAATPEGRHRAASLRRRRPSTSQSNYSIGAGDNRIASPAPQQQQQSSVVSAPRAVTSDQLAKASALLDSVVDSIQSPRSNPQVIQPPPEPSVPIPATVDSQPTQPSPTARHRALADALFGVQERPKIPDDDDDEVPSPTTPSPLAAPVPVTSSHVVLSPSDLTREETPVGRDQDTPKPNALMRDVPTAGNVPSTPPIDILGHSPTPSQIDPALLLESVQRRAEAATAALRNTPSKQKADHVSTRKRINPDQISSPKLVSASTSVDTIPLPPPKAPATPSKDSNSSGLGSRFKSFRRTLRAKPHVPNGEEITPFPLDLKSGGQPTSQSPSPYPSVSSSAGISMTSATDSARSRPPAVSLQSPPASSGPGIKGFMSRFRKHRTADALHPHSHTHPGPSNSVTSPLVEKMVPLHPQIHSAPATKSQFSTGPSTPRPGTAQTFTPEPTIPENSTPPQPEPPAPAQEDVALRQLFDAAANLGLDQSEIGALLARSPSAARSTAWSRLARENSVTGNNRKSIRSIGRASTISQYTQYTTYSEGRQSLDSNPPPVPQPSAEVKQLNIRKNTEPLTPRPRPNRNEDASNPVVRRTIVFANDLRTSGFDFGSITRKQSTSRKRRSAGAGSLQSNRSIQDRAPTPPPPQKNGGRRFSVDTSSPPVPQLPGTLAVPSDHLHPGQMEKSNSAYDSLYDMYAGETRAGTSANPDLPGGQHPFNEPMPESTQQAVEVVELANGEIIWSIVNGLRDDDAESAYGDRASFTSEYSQNEAVKVFFKEHGRKSSKSSGTSFLSRKKNTRPETKILYSSSAKIGRLIESLSQGVDSGSFNITPDRSQSHVGHSASSSFGSSVDMQMTVEERLTAMLDSMASP